ncbi:sigma-70 family RNA polymerase sigma factor [Sporosarcina sp. A2]|uniref:sigma-70 family RNA polymerase sigma factor n=1 Tax=Sporosarcina sp. A2 TaxID=3393449 RepID=UPI003D7B30AB
MNREESNLIDGELHTEDSIIKKYKNLVYKHANRLGRRDFHFIQDLSQEGFIGLLDAFKRYEDDKGAKFITYATQYVRGYMTRLHDKRDIVYTPINVVRTAWRIQRGELWELQDSEISQKLEITEREVESSRIYFKVRFAASLDNQVYSDSEEHTLYGFINFNEDFSSAAVEGYCKGMSERESLIIRSLAAGYTQAEIARNIGLSKSRIAQHTKKIKTRIERTTNF